MSIHSLLKLDPTTRIPAMQVLVHEPGGEESPQLKIDDGFRLESFQSKFSLTVKEREFMIKIYRKDKTTQVAKLYQNGSPIKLDLPPYDTAAFPLTNNMRISMFLYRAQDTGDNFKELCITTTFTENYDQKAKVYSKRIRTVCYSVLSWNVARASVELEIKNCKNDAPAQSYQSKDS